MHERCVFLDTTIYELTLRQVLVGQATKVSWGEKYILLVGPSDGLNSDGLITIQHSSRKSDYAVRRPLDGLLTTLLVNLLARPPTYEDYYASASAYIAYLVFLLSGFFRLCLYTHPLWLTTHPLGICRYWNLLPPAVSYKISLVHAYTSYSSLLSSWSID